MSSASWACWRVRSRIPRTVYTVCITTVTTSSSLATGIYIPRICWRLAGSVTRSSVVTTRKVEGTECLQRATSPSNLGKGLLYSLERGHGLVSRTDLHLSEVRAVTLLTLRAVGWMSAPSNRAKLTIRLVHILPRVFSSENIVYLLALQMRPHGDLLRDDPLIRACRADPES